MQHIINIVSDNICEFTLAKNRTNVKHAESSFRNLGMQNHTVKINKCVWNLLDTFTS